MDNLTQPLTRLRDPNVDHGQLSETEKRIISYVKFAVDAGVIEKIERTDGIHDYYVRFLTFRLPPGLYVLDGQRIWTPVDTGMLGACFLVGAPRDSMPIYGMTLFKFSKVHYTRNYVVVFTGCVQTNSGLRFLSSIQGFSAYNPDVVGKRGKVNMEHPVAACPGISPKAELAYIFAELAITEGPKTTREVDDVEEVYDEEADDYEDN